MLAVLNSSSSFGSSSTRCLAHFAVLDFYFSPIYGSHAHDSDIREPENF
jgi:hypothetical protein